MNFEAKLATTLAGRDDPDSLDDLARAALAEGEEERALPLLRRAAFQCDDSRLWQWTGLLERALDKHELAIKSFEKAVQLAPDDASIAHGRARVVLEAGLDAVPLFDRARQLGPPRSDVLTGWAAAMLAAGRGEEAAAEFETILTQVPLWIEGHAHLAQLRSLLGKPELATASLDHALAVKHEEPALWQALFDLHLRREDYGALAASVARARAAGQLEGLLAEFEAIAAAEVGASDRADILFAAAPQDAQPRLAVWRIRHLLRSGRSAEAVQLIDREVASERAPTVWPYAASAWRLAGDQRSGWLSDPRLVSVIDLRPSLPPLDKLAALLRQLHVAKGEYLDQSVRGGTQTDGPLLSRIEPEIQALRAAIVDAVEATVRSLPPPDPRHPLLAPRRDRRIRIAGSWSVRLRGAGYHSNHVHPQGWFSSALYVSLPPRERGEDVQTGWLKLGEPPASLGLDLPPERLIEPKVGRLVLFPSWMWHGTRPFAQGERLTVAFDVTPPR